MQREIKNVLDQLRSEDRKEVCFFLHTTHQISKSKLDEAITPYNLTDLLVQHFSDGAPAVLENVLRLSNHNDLADRVASWRKTWKPTGPEAMEWKGSNYDSRPEGAEGGLDLKKPDLDCYDMSKKRVAFVVCIKEKRDGAEKDIDTVKGWFDKFKFKTPLKECIDPLGKDIIPKLEAFRDEINQSKEEISCCLIVLMAHGNEKGCIVGIDETEVHIEEIIALFNNKQCPKLKQKPKIFIIQACRGLKHDNGVETDDEAIETDTMPMRKLPTASDYFIVYSSQKGFKSYRHEENGSIMVTAIDEVFSKKGMEWHVGDLFTKVNSMMVQKEFKPKYHSSTVKVTTVMESTLTKAIYLA